MGVPGNANALLLRSAAAAGGYQVSRSLRFNSSDSAYLSRTPASAGNRKTWTWAAWVKRTVGSSDDELFSADSSDGFVIRFVGSTSAIRVYSNSGGGLQLNLITSAVYRDPSAWYHLVVSVDTTQATASDRAKIYVNGTQVTAFSTAAYPSQNTDLLANQAIAHFIGKNAWGVSGLNAYLADIHFIDGQALTPSSFTEVSATTGQLIPKAYTGSFGTNGFWLKFSDNSAATATTLGKDYSGNNNNWTPNNLSVTAGAGNDSLVDTPTSYGTDTGAGGEVRGNYATLNPLSAQANAVLANGNLDWSRTNTTSMIAQSTIAMSSGKWYCEFTSTTGSNMFGLQRVGGTVTTSFLGGNADSWGYYRDNGNKYNNNTNSAYGASYTNNDVIGVAFDADNGTLTFYKNGVSQGQAYSGLTSGPYTFALGNGASGATASVNFGQRPFAYTAPSGFKALVDTNLPAPVVAKPSTVMDVLTWTGSGGNRTLSGLGFSPDLVWGKSRSAAYNHQLYDVVRGAGNNKDLSSSLTAAEGSATTAASQYGFLSAFTSDGFTVANGTDGSLPNAYWNASGTTYVAWAFDAGSSTVTNTQGSITSSVRANASAGFSIVTYTGTGSNATVGHGLGVAPFMFIVKNRSTSSDWDVYHGSLPSPATNRIVLQSTAAAIGAGGTSSWNSTSPTSTVVSLGSSTSANSSGSNHVMYCFAPVAGYSSFGSYTGNGSADGPFVYTGFRPRWIMVKVASGVTSNWQIIDTERTGNPNGILFPNLSNAEDTSSNSADILSNGFKIRVSTNGFNYNTGTYIYAAFAESPFQFSRAR